MTVRELIVILQNCPQEMDVWIEGCDCTGEPTGTRIDSSKGHRDIVLIERD